MSLHKVLVWTVSVMAAEKETSAISTYEDWRKEIVQAGGTCKASFPVNLTLLGALLLGVDGSAMSWSA